MAAEFDQKRAHDLMGRAFRALDSGGAEDRQGTRANAVLRFVRDQALAYADLGDPAKAIGVLREGTTKCPDVWLLWQLLGNNLSDGGRFEEAFQAYEQGLGTDKSSLESLNLNYAIALLRSGQAMRAREWIRPILDAPDFKDLDGSLRARILALELEALRCLDKRDAAVARFEAIGGEDFGDDAGADLSMLWSEYAQSLFELGRSQDAERAALRSAQFEVKNERALSYLREVRRKPKDLPTNHYQILVEGEWSGSSDGIDQKPRGFFANYSVCADSQEEALSFVAELQPDAVTNLRISEAKLMNTVTQPKGVYSAGSYAFYPGERDS
jgi:tetratricopeptide (TPR) repeat protein